MPKLEIELNTLRRWKHSLGQVESDLGTINSTLTNLSRQIVLRIRREIWEVLDREEQMRGING